MLRVRRLLPALPMMRYRFVLLLLLGVFVLHFSRILFLGQIIFPHDNAVEVCTVPKNTDAYRFNRKFSDESSAFIPELANNLRFDRKAWLITWNSHIELGRPAFQGSLSRAFVLTNLLSYCTSNPFILYTTLILLSVGLTAGFFLLFLRSLGLHPVACGCASIGLGFTTAISYWLCFVMFISATCWLVCLLWLITEFTKKPSWLLAIGLAFATYCLLVAGYPQVTILFAYLVGAYALIRFAQMSGTQREKFGMLFGLLGCAGVGVLASLPVYLDLLFIAKDSARIDHVSDSFFLSVLPPTHNLRELASFLMTLFDWSWLGNAIDPKYPLDFNGLSFTPVFGSLIWLSFILKKRGAILFWQIILTLCLIGTIFPAVYLFSVHYLGFGLSRIQLLGGGIVPGFVLSAFAVDAILRGDLRVTIRSVSWFFAPLVMESIVAFLVWRQFPINPMAVAVTCVLVVALLCAIYWHSPPALIGVAVMSTFLYGHALILSRPLSTVHVSSKLIDAIKVHTPDGRRFAIADKTISALPPNQEALFGLSSVNSYDSLSSRRYQELVNGWSLGGTNTYGRHFKFLNIESALADPVFAWSNVEVILSKGSLETERLRLADESNGIKLYETTARPVDLLQIPLFRLLSDSEATVDLSSSAPANLRACRVEYLSDFQNIAVTPVPVETLLLVSQQYHRAWRAGFHDQSFRTVIVNKFYQGVILPPHTSAVHLSFRPFVLWSWLPQLFFLSCTAFLLARSFWVRRHNSADSLLWTRP